MNFNFKNNYIIILLLTLLIISCFCFINNKTTSVLENFNNNFELPETFLKNFKSLGTGTGDQSGHVFYILEDTNTNTYVSSNTPYYIEISNNINVINNFTINNELDISKNDFLTTYPNYSIDLNNNRYQGINILDKLLPADQLYNFIETDTSNIYLKNLSSNIKTTLNIKKDTTNTFTRHTRLVVLLDKGESAIDTIYIRDLNRNIMNIDIIIDNSYIVQNGKILNLIPIPNNVVTPDPTPEISNNIIYKYPPALLNQLLSGNTTNITQNELNSFMLSNTQNIGNYNSPYYNNSFEYAMNSLSNPLVNNLDTNNPSQYSQMLFQNNNMCNSDNCCHTHKDVSNNNSTNENSTNENSTNENSTNENSRNTNLNNVFSRDVRNTNNNNSKNNSYLELGINDNIKNNITSKNKNKKSLEITSLNENNPISTSKTNVKTNFHPNLSNSNITSEIPRPILSDFSKF